MKNEYHNMTRSIITEIIFPRDFKKREITSNTTDSKRYVIFWTGLLPTHCKL